MVKGGGGRVVGKGGEIISVVRWSEHRFAPRSPTPTVPRENGISLVREALCVTQGKKIDGTGGGKLNFHGRTGEKER